MHNSYSTIIAFIAYTARDVSTSSYLNGMHSLIALEEKKSDSRKSERGTEKLHFTLQKTSY